MIRKNRLLILGIILSVFIFILLINSPKKETTISPTDQQKNTIETTPLVAITPIPDWNSTQATDYAIQFPPEWKAETQEANKARVVIKPQTLSTNQHYPQFAVVSEPTGKAALETERSLYRAIGLTESKATLRNVPVVKLSGTIPYKMVGEQQINQPLQQTVLILPQEATLFVITYSYEGAKPDPKQELFFMKMAESISLK